MKQQLLKRLNRIPTWFGAMILVMTFTASAYAKDITVEGTVSSADDNSATPGVSITVKGTNNGTVTDTEGKYKITVPENATLVFSFIGYETQEVAVNNQSIINVTLSLDTETLDEVVVVGYGTQKKSHLTGAISKLEGGSIAAIQANRVDDALAGKLGGVLIQNQSGEPGADPRIQIRAAASLSGDSNPLIVVDGFPIS
ncbi:MAG: carboxypeptidase-like regulatory domain-containing protein, partial [Spirosomaceae bacterium]|nr:carboxypeptidase-like regulatory domain-containing protein [Spirosomataceae bacterium]